MPVRLVVSIAAKPGKGADLAQAFRERTRETTREDGCMQFEIFRSAEDPDRLVMLELWRDQAALDAHAALNKTKPPLAPELRERAEREDYSYTRTS